MAAEPRTTYEARWYDQPVTCCSRCHFVQFEGESNHVGWCTREQRRIVEGLLADLLAGTVGGRFTDDEQLLYDALCDELDRLDPPSAPAEMARAGAPGLWDGAEGLP